MQVLFEAGFVSVDEIDGALVVGFADSEFEPTRYFMFQRSLDPEDDDGVYLEHTDQAYGAYGAVTSCRLSDTRIVVTVDATTADQLETATTFAVAFSCDGASLSQVRGGLRRIFDGTAAISS